MGFGRGVLLWFAWSAVTDNYFAGTFLAPLSQNKICCLAPLLTDCATCSAARKPAIIAHNLRNGTAYLPKTAESL